jgi:hypothetical protein
VGGSNKLTISVYSHISAATSKYSERNKLTKIREVVSVVSEDIVWSI